MKIEFKYIYIISLLCLAALVSSCHGRNRIFQSDIVAEVGKAKLTKDDVRITLPDGTSTEDSLIMVENYVDSWVRKQIKLQEAERVLEKSGLDFESMVSDYRNSLLTHQLDKYYVDMGVDTLISDEVVKAYYDEHNPEFKLDRNIVKGRIVKMPKSFRQQTKLKELMVSPNSDRQQDFLDMTIKNELNLTEFKEWIGLDELLNYIPTYRSKNYDYLLSTGKVNEFADDDYKYYVQVTEYKSKGEQAPLDWVNIIIRNMIYNQRCGSLIKTVEDSLYKAAIDGKKVKIYLQTNND